jgi:transcription elongation factor GreA
MQRTPITTEGFAMLKKELEHLERVERFQVIKAIEEARAHGDLSENAEYHAAKERQGYVEGRISYLQQKIAFSDVIDITNLSCDKVVFGVKVKISSLESGNEVVYQLVGSDESDAKRGKISIISPIGAALIGKEVGAEITIKTPSGFKVYEILDIFN